MPLGERERECIKCDNHTCMQVHAAPLSVLNWGGGGRTWCARWWGANSVRIWLLWLCAYGDVVSVRFWLEWSWIRIGLQILIKLIFKFYHKVAEDNQYFLCQLGFNSLPWNLRNYKYKLKYKHSLFVCLFVCSFVRLFVCLFVLRILYVHVETDHNWKAPPPPPQPPGPRVNLLFP